MEECVIYKERKRSAYIISARFVDGYGKFDYFEILVVVRVNQIVSGSSWDSLGIARVKVVGVSVVVVHQGKYGSPCIYVMHYHASNEYN